MNLESKAVKELVRGGIAAVIIGCAALMFVIQKAEDIFSYREVYNNLLSRYADVNENGKVDEKEERTFQNRIINSLKDRKVDFVQIIDIPYTEYPQDIKTHKLIPPEEFVEIAEGVYQ